MRPTLVISAVLLAPFAGGAFAAAAKPAKSTPAAKPAGSTPAAKPAAKAAPKKAAPVESGPAAASPDQLAAAEQVFYGSHECEFNQTAQVDKNARHPGYVDVKQGKATYVMKPVLSSTGAVRLEDVRGQTLMVQIASKSMLLDVKAGRRIVDECVSSKHREAVERYKQAKLDEAAAFAAAAASGVAAVPGSGETRALLSGPGPAAASAPAPATGLDAAARAAVPASSIPAAPASAPAQAAPAASAASAS